MKPRQVGQAGSEDMHPEVQPSTSWQHTNQQPYKSQDPKPTSLICNAAETYANQCITQTLLSARYPPHFVHQRPTSITFNGTILSSELQRLSEATIPTRELCPTPDTTPTLAQDAFSPSPPNVDTTISTSPSLSESLAELFGTNKIRNILNIEAPSKYLVLEVHLPAIAFMLNVELGRLRAVLEMTQRLTPEQLQQISQESRDIISIHSTSEEYDDAGEP
ncbi:hypothetical protein KR093_006853 [Drosophila rubida]|uniref:Uncharacterized protein n=1 Tax=Drosophila rubida TaxID=30044 RepID=A0AAD4K0H3_9MUSC|nr:hypothetical protein KR093_006853 [Drosophila rubida]